MDAHQQQIHQLKEIILSQGLKLEEQSIQITQLNKEVVGLQSKIEESNRQNQGSIQIIDEKSSDKLSSLPRNSSDDLNVIVIPSNELERIQKEKAQTMPRKDSVIEQLTKQLEDAVVQQNQAEAANNELQKQITELEQILIKTKLNLAMQSGELDEAKGEISKLKRQISEQELVSRRTSNDSTGSNGNNPHSGITAPILSLKNYDPAGKITAINQNRQLIMDLQQISQMKSCQQEVISPEHVQHRLVMNSQCLVLPNDTNNTAFQAKLDRSQTINCIEDQQQPDGSTAVLPGDSPTSKSSSSSDFSIASPRIYPVQYYKKYSHSASDIYLNIRQANRNSISKQSLSFFQNIQSNISIPKRSSVYYIARKFKISQQSRLSQNFQKLCPPDTATITALRLSQLDTYCEQVAGKNMLSLIMNQPPPTFLVLSQQEQDEACKAINEITESSSSVSSNPQIAELAGILDTRFLYSEQQSDSVKQKINLILKRGPLPLQIRKRIWPLVTNEHIPAIFFDFLSLSHQLIGNKLRITKTIYKNLEEQMDAITISSKASGLISEDLHRTYPSISIFDKGSQTNLTLQRILEQLDYFRPDIGYVQGMAYPAAILFMYLGDSYRVFKYLTNLLAGNNFISNLFKFKVVRIKVYLETFEYFLEKKHPNCVKHLKEHNISSDIFLIEWFYTLFCRAFTFPVVAKIWDMMLAQGEVTFYRVAVAVFGCIEKELLDKNFDDSLFLIRNCTFKIDADQLLKSIYSQKITTEQMLKKYAKSIEEPEKPFPGPTSSPFTKMNHNSNTANDVATNTLLVKERSLEQKKHSESLDQFDFAVSVNQLKKRISTDYMNRQLSAQETKQPSKGLDEFSAQQIHQADSITLTNKIVAQNPS